MAENSTLGLSNDKEMSKSPRDSYTDQTTKISETFKGDNSTKNIFNEEFRRVSTEQSRNISTFEVTNTSLPAGQHESKLRKLTTISIILLDNLALTRHFNDSF